jgi:redox-sensitive bicupin YhaK (pirin superfamily)
MLRKIDHKNMGGSNLGWLRSLFHFSFAEYYNPDNIDFGILRVINDDLIEAGTGFDTHPHKDMEIISYVVQGDLTHGDSMGNNGTIQRGHVQYMSAGTGVRHSEHNLGRDMLRILQIWVYPDKKGYTPQYGDFRFNWENRKSKWFHMVSGATGEAPVRINQDVNFYSLELEEGEEIGFRVDNGRQAYIVQIEGESTINNIELKERDAAEVVEEDLTFSAKTTSHYLLIEMKRS